MEGKNEKNYNMDWGGNQYTSGRNAIVKSARNWNKRGKGLFYIDATLSAYDGTTGLVNRDYGAAMKGGADIIFGYGALVGGPAGMIVGGTYTIMSSFNSLIKAPIRSTYYTPCDNTYVVPIIH